MASTTIISTSVHRDGQIITPATFDVVIFSYSIINLYMWALEASIGGNSPDSLMSMNQGLTVTRNRRWKNRCHRNRPTVTVTVTKTFVYGDGDGDGDKKTFFRWRWRWRWQENFFSVTVTVTKKVFFGDGDGDGEKKIFSVRVTVDSTRDTPSCLKNFEKQGGI